MAENFRGRAHRERRRGFIIPKVIVEMNCGEGRDSFARSGEELKIGAINSLRHAPTVALGANRTKEAGCVRLAHQRRLFSPIRGCIFLLVFTSLMGTCVAFRQDPPMSPTRVNRSSLQSQKNLVDDVQEGETSRLQRLLPSAWRNKNMSSWDVVESVSSLRGGGTDEAVNSFVVRNTTLPPPNDLDRKVGKVLRLLGRVVVAQSLLTIVTSDDHALLTEVCVRLLLFCFLRNNNHYGVSYNRLRFIL